MDEYEEVCEVCQQEYRYCRNSSYYIGDEAMKEIFGEDYFDWKEESE